MASHAKRGHDAIGSVPPRRMMDPHVPRTRAVRRSATSDDEAIIRACIAGDGSAWERLVDRYAGLVYSIPRRLGLPEAASDDVFQAVFLQALRRLPSLRDSKSLPKWFITTT